jgi:hypothetical protein
MVPCTLSMILGLSCSGEAPGENALKNGMNMSYSYQMWLTICSRSKSLATLQGRHTGRYGTRDQMITS